MIPLKYPMSSQGNHPQVSVEGWDLNPVLLAHVPAQPAAQHEPSITINRE